MVCRVRQPDSAHPRPLGLSRGAVFAILGRIVAAHRWVFATAAVAVLVCASVVGVLVPERWSAGGFLNADAESVRAAQVVRDRIGQGSADVVVLYRRSDLVVTDQRFQRAVEDSLSAAPADTIAAALTYWSRQLPLLASTDLHATAVPIMLVGADDTARTESFRRLREGLRADRFTLTYAGPIALVDEALTRTKQDMLRAELIVAPAVLLLLVLIFRSVLAAVLPLLVGGLSVGATLAVMRLLSQLTEVPLLVLNAVMAIGFALAVDAALLVVMRFREERPRRQTVSEAVAATVATAGRTVCCSGLTLCAICLAFLFFPLPIARSLGVAALFVVGLGAALSVTLLPAALAILGHRLDALSLPRHRPHGQVSAGQGGWAAVARMVMARPVRYLVGVAACLIVLAVPFGHTTFGVPDQRELPAGSPGRQAMESLSSDFAFGGFDAIQVVTTFAAPINSPQGAQQLRDWSQTLVRVPGVRAGFIAAQHDRSAVIYLAFHAPPEDPATREVVQAIRGLPPPVGGEVLVSGLAAMAVDTFDLLGARLPAALLYVALIVFGLLAVILRSVLLPIKALMVNVLSLGASFGALTWLFQDGHLSWLVGATPTGYINVLVPTVMLLVLVGVSMDYELFLLCRIREHYDATGDNTTAVAAGLQRSGPVISAAALVLLVVTAIFAISADLILVKQLCLGTFLAVALDATAVRALLVPAIMRLLGRANWWLPWARPPVVEGPLEVSASGGRG